MLCDQSVQAMPSARAHMSSARCARSARQSLGVLCVFRVRTSRHVRVRTQTRSCACAFKGGRVEVGTR